MPSAPGGTVAHAREALDLRILDKDRPVSGWRRRGADVQVQLLPDGNTDLVRSAPIPRGIVAWRLAFGFDSVLGFASPEDEAGNLGGEVLCALCP